MHRAGRLKPWEPKKCKVFLSHAGGINGANKVFIGQLASRLRTRLEFPATKSDRVWFDQHSAGVQTVGQHVQAVYACRVGCVFFDEALFQAWSRSREDPTYHETLFKEIEVILERASLAMFASADSTQSSSDKSSPNFRFIPVAHGIEIEEAMETIRQISFFDNKYFSVFDKTIWLDLQDTSASVNSVVEKLIPHYYAVRPPRTLKRDKLFGPKLFVTGPVAPPQPDEIQDRLRQFYNNGQSKIPTINLASHISGQDGVVAELSSFPSEAPPRTELYQKISTSFASRTTVRTLVHGMGGVGKTTLATEYCGSRTVGIDALSDYNLIYWFFPSKHSDHHLKDQFRVLYEQLTGITLERKVVGSVYRYLGSVPRWLLVFDAVDASEDINKLVSFLPNYTGGQRDWDKPSSEVKKRHVLVTSRHFAPGDNNSANFTTNINVQGFTTAEIRQMFNPPDQENDVFRRCADEEFNLLGQTLGFHPMALEHARRIMKRKARLSFGRRSTENIIEWYLAELRSKPHQLLELKGRDIQPSEQQVLPALFMSISHFLASCSEEFTDLPRSTVANILRLFLCLNADAIPWDFLRQSFLELQLSEKLADQFQELLIDSTIVSLVRDRAIPACSIHLLMQLAICHFPEFAEADVPSWEQQDVLLLSPSATSQSSDSAASPSAASSSSSSSSSTISTKRAPRSRPRLHQQLPVRSLELMLRILKRGFRHKKYDPAYEWKEYRDWAGQVQFLLGISTPSVETLRVLLFRLAIRVSCFLENLTQYVEAEECFHIAKQILTDFPRLPLKKSTRLAYHLYSADLHRNLRHPSKEARAELEKLLNIEGTEDPISLYSTAATRGLCYIMQEERSLQNLDKVEQKLQQCEAFVRQVLSDPSSSKKTLQKASYSHQVNLAALANNFNDRGYLSFDPTERLVWHQKSVELNFEVLKILSTFSVSRDTLVLRGNLVYSLVQAGDLSRAYEECKKTTPFIKSMFGSSSLVNILHLYELSRRCFAIGHLEEGDAALAKVLLLIQQTAAEPTLILHHFGNSSLAEIAARFGHVVYLQTLPQDYLDTDQRTIRHLAAFNDRNIELTRSLQCNPMAKDSFGTRPFEIAAAEGQLETFLFYKQMLDTQMMHEALNRASSSIHTAVVKHLLEECDLDLFPVENALSCLMLAAWNNLGDTAKMILARFSSEFSLKSFLELQAHRGTALHFAAFNGHAEMCSLLLEYHPDLLLAQNQSGETAIDVALDRHQYHVFDVFSRFQNSHGQSKLLFGKNQDSAIHSAIHRASNSQNFFLSFLVGNSSCEERAEMLETKNSLGYTPLIAATRLGQASTVRMLLDAGADFQAETPLGDNIAMLTLFCFFNKDLVRLILGMPGLKLHRLNHYGLSFYHLLAGFDLVPRFTSDYQGACPSFSDERMRVAELELGDLRDQLFLYLIELCLIEDKPSDPAMKYTWERVDNLTPTTWTTAQERLQLATSPILRCHRLWLLAKRFSVLDNHLASELTGTFENLTKANISQLITALDIVKAIPPLWNSNMVSLICRVAFSTELFPANTQATYLLRHISKYLVDPSIETGFFFGPTLLPAHAALLQAKKSFQVAWSNLYMFQESLGMKDLVFDENNTIILGIDDAFSLHLTFEPNSERLYLYSSLVDSLPIEEAKRLELYTALLEGAMLGGGFPWGGAGVAVKEELVLQHAVLEMNEGSSFLLSKFVPEFVSSVESWRALCKSANPSAEWSRHLHSNRHDLLFDYELQFAGPQPHSLVLSPQAASWKCVRCDRIVPGELRRCVDESCRQLQTWACPKCTYIENPLAEAACICGFEKLPLQFNAS